MLKWVQGSIASVTGLAEPEYGEEYIHSITKTVENKQPYRTTTVEDLKWQNPPHTNVETETYYFTDLSSQTFGFAQVIHSNIVGLHTTAQLTFRLFNRADPSKNVWTSTKLENFAIAENGIDFTADGLSIVHSESEVHFKATVCAESEIDLTFTRIAPGVIVGKDGTTIYGNDLENPWGTMRHVFWPRNSISGSVTVVYKDGSKDEINMDNALSMFVKACQGMKPNHAAKSWNFLNYHDEHKSAILMEFVTPKSYANTKVSVGIVCEGDKILAVCVNNEAVHKDGEVDEVGWTVPKAISVEFNGFTSETSDESIAQDNKKYNFKAVSEGSLKTLVERVDVMAEIPAFVKNIVSGVAGAKPYIYQYADDFSLDVNGTETKGLGWCEVTFISTEDLDQ